MTQKFSRRIAGLGALVAVAATTLATAAPAGAVVLDCDDVITSDTVLTADVGPCSSGGLVIGADNVTLDLGGHTGLGTPHKTDGVGILI
ncbi:hypothetical protein BH18ACT4_BH18ACT4_06850 [soil metagenome]